MSVEVTRQPDPSAALTRPPRALVVREPRPEEIGAEVDWSSWYLTDEEDMGEATEHALIITDLESSLKVLARERSWRRVLINHDQFFAWLSEEPLVRVSPDVYLLDDPPPRPYPRMWETWREGVHPPRFAVEVVSDEWRKDYDDNPPKYAQLGCRELVLFDPEAALGTTASSKRVPLQVYRLGADGLSMRVYRGPGPAPSRAIDAWLVVVADDGAVTLRVARDDVGLDIVPTAEEASAAERRAREEAERQLAELRDELARLRSRRDG